MHFKVLVAGIVSIMKYDFICDCDAEKFPLIEKAVGGVYSYKNNMFKALLCSNCLKDHEEVIASS